MRSDRRVPAHLEVGELGPAEAGEGDTQPAGRHHEGQAAPGAGDGPAVAVLHVRWEAVQAPWWPLQVVGDTGGIGAEGDGAEDPWGVEVGVGVSSPRRTSPGLADALTPPYTPALHRACSCMIVYMLACACV